VGGVDVPLLGVGGRGRKEELHIEFANQCMGSPPSPIAYNFMSN